MTPVMPALASTNTNPFSTLENKKEWTMSHQLALIKRRKYSELKERIGDHISIGPRKY